MRLFNIWLDKFNYSLTILISALFIVSSAQLVSAEETEKKESEFKIGFQLWKPGKIYDEAMAGIIDGLKLKGIKYKAVVLKADKDKLKARENFKKLDDMKLDVIYSLSSAGTKIAKKLELKTPVIATVINHPASLGVSQAENEEGTALTGTSYYVDAKKQLELYRSLFPKIMTVGMIFDEKNPAGRLAEEPFMKQAAKSVGLEFVSKGITDASQLSETAEKLLEAKVDLIVVPTNRLVYGNLDKILAVTNRSAIPVVSMNKQGVENGAIAGLFADTYNLGRQAAVIASRILHNKENVRKINYEFTDQPDVIVNLGSASKLDYDFPASVLGSAKIIIQ